MTAVVVDGHVDVTSGLSRTSPINCDPKRNLPEAGHGRGGVVLSGLGESSACEESQEQSSQRRHQQRQQKPWSGRGDAADDIVVEAAASGDRTDPCTSNGTVARGVHGVRFEMPVSSYAETTDVEGNILYRNFDFVFFILLTIQLVPFW